MTLPLVIYHSPCLDGFTAAWIIARTAKAGCGSVDLHPAKYGDDPPDVTDRDVVVVDFSYPRDVMLRMDQQAHSLLVLDHHKTAAEALEGLPFAVFDMERSGASMVYDHIVGRAPEDRRNWLVNAVEDRDLWRWQRPHTKEITSYLMTIDQTIEEWERVYREGADVAIDRGKGIVAYIDKCVRDIAASAAEGYFLGRRVPIVNCSPQFASEVGNVLARNAPYVVIWRQTSTGSFSYSLRSARENPDHADVSAIAKLYGGGGHKHAAGFEVDVLVHRFC